MLTLSKLHFSIWGGGENRGTVQHCSESNVPKDQSLSLLWKCFSSVQPPLHQFSPECKTLLEEGVSLRSHVGENLAQIKTLKDMSCDKTMLC